MMPNRRDWILNYYRNQPRSDTEDLTSGLRRDWVGFNEDIGLPVNPSTDLPAPLTQYQVMMGEYPGKHTVTNKANKVGVTELFLRKNIRRATVGDCQGYQILYGSSKLGLANENIDRTTAIFDHCDKLRAMLDGEPTASEIRLKNGAEFIALPRKVSSLRSWPRVKSIFLDEAAHYELIEDKEFFAAALGRLVNTNGYMDIVSTPKGQRGYFYQIYTDAVAGRNTFKHFEVLVDQGLAAGLLNQEVLDEAKRTMAPSMYAQEFLGEFNAGANAAIEPELDRRMIEHYESE
jgi:phage FluMu gp28-like protein